MINSKSFQAWLLLVAMAAGGMVMKFAMRSTVPTWIVMWPILVPFALILIITLAGTVFEATAGVVRWVDKTKKKGW